MKTKLYYVIIILTVVTLVASPNSFAQQVPFANVPFDINNIPEPVPPPAAVRDFFQLDPYYQQWISVRGFPVLASAEVSPYACKGSRMDHLSNDRASSRCSKDNGRAHGTLCP